MSDARDISADDVLAAIDYADTIANRDTGAWARQPRAERVADVQTQLLRAIALGLVACANELASNARATYNLQP